jgi:hypothetical protein
LAGWVHLVDLPGPAGLQLIKVLRGVPIEKQAERARHRRTSSRPPTHDEQV